jgi:hypothetical protein
MAILVSMEWPGLTEAQYEAAMRELNMDADPPVGGVVHLAAFTGTGLRVVDVWESEAAFQAFAEARILPAVQRVGITSEPRVDIAPLHNLYVPALSAVGLIGASSFPSSAVVGLSSASAHSHGFRHTLGDPLLHDTSALSGLK